ncbi:MAG: serine/threonine protein kinase [Cyanobacteria bacterium]|nr:serine/threonine protein kinase [Cyanobacteriota bacterium]
MNGDFQPNQRAAEPVIPARTGKPNDPLIGSTLDGRFEIEGILGQGGMSVVYKAHQTRVNRPVAIKTLKLQVDSKANYRERFQREINSLCRLNHPNVVTIHDCIIGPDDQPYIIMDYLSGKSLEKLILDEGPLQLERFSRIFVQVCSALDHAHKKGIIHRDLKPGNIVLMDDEMDFVKVVDFGLAKLGQDNLKLTHSGELWGSPPYMSPEQCMGESGDERSDIYSLGAVMYELITGTEPFTGKSVYDLIQQHINDYPPRLRDMNPQLLSNMDAVEEVIFKALDKDPDERFQSAQEVQDAIIRACAPVLPRGVSEYLVHIAQQARMRPNKSGIRMDVATELAVLEAADAQTKAQLAQTQYDENSPARSIGATLKKARSRNPVPTQSRVRSSIADSSDAVDVSRQRLQETIKHYDRRQRVLTMILFILSGLFVIMFCIVFHFMLYTMQANNERHSAFSESTQLFRKQVQDGSTPTAVPEENEVTSETGEEDEPAAKPQKPRQAAKGKDKQTKNKGTASSTSSK